jgi:pyruvate,water dikinase
MDSLYRLPTLAEITLSDRARVGGKALHLAILVRRGLPVPSGFVIPTDVFSLALQSNQLLGRAEDVARRPTEPAIRELQAALEQAPLPEGLEAALGVAAARLGPRVAVRSSAIEEDGRRRSFAGQHVTELNVSTKLVGQALRRCWASYYTPRAFAYRARTGHGPAAAGMAVLVQVMIEPVASGALFTVNPLNGSWREMTVESTWGLGEGLMAGQVTPHWFLVRRPRRAPRPVQRLLSRVRLQLVQQDLPDIAEQWVCDAKGDVLRQPVPASRHGHSSLDRDTLFRLCRLGLRVEGQLGEPQDVEWALDDAGELHLLQARPITTAGPPRMRDDVLWTRRFVGERWPEPATPLGWSLLAPILDWFIAYPDTQLRHLGGGPAMRLVRSRPYINATVFRHLAFKLPGAPLPRFMLELVPEEEEEELRRRFAMAPGFGVYASIFRETFAERRWRRFRWNPFTNHRAWWSFQKRLESELPAVSRAPGSAGDAIRLCQAQIALVRDYVSVHVTSLLFANLYYQLLESALSAWLPEDAARLMEGLATCPPGNLTLATNAALWTLSQHATAEDVERLEAGQPPESPFAERLGAFLAEYGHRSAASWEVFSPRWASRPALLAGLVRNQGRPGADDPGLRSVRQQEAFEIAFRELRALAPSGLRSRVLERLVHFTREYLLLRENQRFWFDRLLFAMQRTLLSLGAQFVAEGWLSAEGDIAYLTWEEVQGLAQGTLSPEPAAGWVERRRAQRETDAADLPPVFLRGDVGVADAASGARLQGLGISPGRASGRVRILRSPAEAHRLGFGEILVTHAVDPGWTPLFGNAGAVVLEMGSRLSHGAVVAREYRVPAVVNIDGVTRRLVDGQEVTVDGTRGIVWIHP